MRNVKVLLKSLLVALLRPSLKVKLKANIPYGQISFEKLIKGNVIYEREIPAFVRTLPVTTGTLHKNFLKNLKAPKHKLFVIIGKNWRVWGNQGAVITNDNFLIKDVSQQFDQTIHPVFSRLTIPAPVHADGMVAVLAISLGSVYFHWMFDVLPRIALLKEAGQFNRIDKFVVDFASGKFQAETLLRMGIEPSQIIPSQDYWNFHLQAQELIVPSLVSPLDKPSLQACLYLRDMFAAEMSNADKPQMLYVQRLGGRTVLNEDEVVTWFKGLGGVIVHPEKMTVGEQAQLFAGASMVIGPHGAGFTNIVFCRPGTIVIDLFSQQWVNPCYWIIANHLQLKYGYLQSAKTGNAASPKAANMMVDLTKLKTLLSKLNQV